MKVSVITVNFNQAAVTESLINSILQYYSPLDLDIIVVDNGSKDNHVGKWQEIYPQIKFIRSEENLGFAGGNNLGTKYAAGTYLFYVNNDTEFTAGLVEALCAVMDTRPGVGMVSPKIRFFHNKQLLQYAGFTEMNFMTCRNKCIGEFEEDHGQYDGSTGPTGYIHGAAMMVRRQALDEAGLMAENFFLYYEEIDWCERIRRAGFGIWFCAEGLIYHKESISVGKNSPLKEYFMNRNRILFMRRNAPMPARLIFFLHFTLLVAPRNIISYISKKRTELIKPLLQAMVWNLSHPVDSMDKGYKI